MTLAFVPEVWDQFWVAYLAALAPFVPIFIQALIVGFIADTVLVLLAVTGFIVKRKVRK
jgi:hypothetical protein